MSSGKLYIVATPIGNLKDISYRAVETLQEVDFIACEDTRKTKVLCNFYNIETKLISYHDFNKEKKTADLIKRLKMGESMALVSDAGTPAISDPGFYLVREARNEGLEVYGIPGPCAFINALAISGFPTDSFSFYGFMPPKKGRQKFKEKLVADPKTLILYESVHRIIKTLTELGEIMPARKVAVAREMTKKFEEFIFGDFEEVIKTLEAGNIKGEFVILISNLPKEKKVKDYQN